jgi:chaperone modulatory protein CbpM
MEDSMATQSPDLDWLDEGATITITELSRACALSPEELDELVGYGAIEPLRAPQREPLFAADCVMPLRAAARLRRDFDLDLVAISLLLDYQQRIDGLERRLRSLEARLPAPVRR